MLFKAFGDGSVCLSNMNFHTLTWYFIYLCHSQYQVIFEGTKYAFILLRRMDHLNIVFLKYMVNYVGNITVIRNVVSFNLRFFFLILSSFLGVLISKFAGKQSKYSSNSTVLYSFCCNVKKKRKYFQQITIWLIACENIINNEQWESSKSYTS